MVTKNGTNASILLKAIYVTFSFIKFTVYIKCSGNYIFEV